MERGAINTLRDIGVQILVLDEIHNILAGSWREQRIVLNTLRFLSNELKLSLVCFGIMEARDAINGDVQLARRFDAVTLPRWTAGKEFEQLVLAIVRNLPLREPSVLTVKGLRRVLQMSGGVSSRIFRMLNDLAIEAIERAKSASPAMRSRRTSRFQKMRWLSNERRDRRQRQTIAGRPQSGARRIALVLACPARSILRLTGSFFAKWLGLGDFKLSALDYRLALEQVARLTEKFRCDPVTLIDMTQINTLDGQVCSLISRGRPLQICYPCADRYAHDGAEGAIPKHWSKAWRITCPARGLAFTDTTEHRGVV